MMKPKKEPFYNLIEEYIVLITFTAAVVITAGTVFTRYVFSVTFSWAEQMSRLLFIWTIFSGVSWAGRIGAHMRVTAVTMFCGEEVGRIVTWIGDIVTVLFGFYMSYKIAVVMLVTIERRQCFAAMTWMPVWTMYLAGILGMLGLALRVLQARVVEIKESKQNRCPSGKEDVR
ncbi:MAG: TRAP transporter small permease [Bacillota bacterium]|jgi:TRAP-type C4-dicarboxylate transport system permease small subunit